MLLFIRVGQKRVLQGSQTDHKLHSTERGCCFALDAQLQARLDFSRTCLEDIEPWSLNLDLESSFQSWILFPLEVRGSANVSD